MTLGPEMFGLKRISDVSSIQPTNKGNGSSGSNPVALNRRGVVSKLVLLLIIILPIQPFDSSACQNTKEESSVL